LVESSISVVVVGGRIVLQNLFVVVTDFGFEVGGLGGRAGGRDVALLLVVANEVVHAHLLQWLGVGVLLRLRIRTQPGLSDLRAARVRLRLVPFLLGFIFDGLFAGIECVRVAEHQLGIL